MGVPRPGDGLSWTPRGHRRSSRRVVHRLNSGRSGWVDDHLRLSSGSDDHRLRRSDSHEHRLRRRWLAQVDVARRGGRGCVRTAWVVRRRRDARVAEGSLTGRFQRVRSDLLVFLHSSNAFEVDDEIGNAHDETQSAEAELDVLAEEFHLTLRVGLESVQAVEHREEVLAEAVVER